MRVDVVVRALDRGAEFLQARDVQPVIGVILILDVSNDVVKGAELGV